MIDRHIRKRIEWAFYNYPKLREQADNKVQEYADRSLSSGIATVGKSSSKNFNSVESGTIKAVDNYPERWCKVVEKTMSHFEGTGKDTLIRLKYFQRQKFKVLMFKLHIADTSVKYWINDILSYALSIAALYKLFTEKEL